MLGTTATPERLDGRGLGEVFDELVCGPDVAELTRLGFLAPAAVYAASLGPDLSGVKVVAGDYEQSELARRMSAGGLVGDAVEHYGRLAAGKPAIAFCCSIEHSELVAQRFRDASYRAERVDDDTSRELRRERIAALGRRGFDVLTNCSLFGEGVDVPVLGAATRLRPTSSLALHLQMVGRALRPAPGKDRAGNSFQFGLPDDSREWSLESKKRRGEQVVKPIRNESGLLEHEPPLVEAPGRLEAMDETTALQERLRTMPYRELREWPRTPEQARFTAKARGYKAGWA